VRTRIPISLAVISLLLAGCAKTIGPVVAAVASTIPLCSSSQLNVLGGRQGEATTAAGDLVFVNVSAKPCRLSGAPRLRLVKASGLALTPITYSPPSEAITSAILSPTSYAELITNWANWCQIGPSSLNIRITLPGGKGSLVAPFDVPPAGALIPQCINKSSVSKFKIIGGYQQTNFQSGSPTSPATVTGTVIPCTGTLFSSKSTWKGLVTLTRNGKVIASQQVTHALKQANPTYALRAAQGIYVLSSTGAGGWKKFIYLGAGKTLKVAIGQYCY